MFKCCASVGERSDWIHYHHRRWPSVTTVNNIHVFFGIQDSLTTIWQRFSLQQTASLNPSAQICVKAATATSQWATEGWEMWPTTGIKQRSEDTTFHRGGLIRQICLSRQSPFIHFTAKPQICGVTSGLGSKFLYPCVHIYTLPHSLCCKFVSHLFNHLLFFIMPFSTGSSSLNTLTYLPHAWLIGGNCSGLFVFLQSQWQAYTHDLLPVRQTILNVKVFSNPRRACRHLKM